MKSEDIEYVELQRLQKPVPFSSTAGENTNPFLVFDLPGPGPADQVANVTLATGAGPTLNRRDSAASDDSQTALICLDSFTDNPTRNVVGSRE